jgi:pimeloyl-ACP methyl ester carboxylesterase
MEARMPVIEANGLKHRYQFTGEGDRTMVWIHGIGGSLDYWQELLPQFSGFRHLSYDVRGMGESEGSDGPVALTDWATDLSLLLSALDVERAIIAGHSMGGVIAQRFSIDHPEQVEALVLISTSSRVGPAAEQYWLKQADQTESGGSLRLAAAQRAVASYNMDEQLPAVSVPTLIIVGDADERTPPGGSVILSRLIKGSELEIYPGIGHNSLREEPKAVQRVDGWLAQFR